MWKWCLVNVIIKRAKFHMSFYFNDKYNLPGVSAVFLCLKILHHTYSKDISPCMTGQNLKQACTKLH